MELTIPPWIVDLFLWVGKLFSAGEWKAMLLLIAVTLAGTHTAKIAWRLSPWQGCDAGCVNLLAALVALICAAFVWPTGGAPWWIAGIIAGPAAIGVFKLFFALLKRFAPEVASVLNADRRKDANPIPPANSPERRGR